MDRERAPGVCSLSQLGQAGFDGYVSVRGNILLLEGERGDGGACVLELPLAATRSAQETLLGVGVKMDLLKITVSKSNWRLTYYVVDGRIDVLGRPSRLAYFLLGLLVAALL